MEIILIVCFLEHVNKSYYTYVQLYHFTWILQTQVESFTVLSLGGTTRQAAVFIGFI